MVWRRYLLICLGAALAVVCAGAVVNYVVDVRQIYVGSGGASYYDRYAQQLVQSKYGLVGNSFPRPIKLRLAELSDADCYVTGSSREMQIDIETMPALGKVCRKVTNLAVSRGAFEDLVAAAGKVAANPHARRLFIGVQSWGFRRAADDGWSEEPDAYLRARAMFHLKAEPNAHAGASAKLQNLINGEYLLRNLEAVWDSGIGHSPFPPIVAIGPDGQAPGDKDEIFCPDGRLQYSRSAVAKIPMPVAAVGEGSYKLSPTVPAFDPAVAAEYRSIAEMLKERGIVTEYILMPFHPKIWECAKPFVCATLTTVERDLRSLAQQQGAKVLGSFDPRKLGLDWRSFMDDMHLAQQEQYKVPVELAQAKPVAAPPAQTELDLHARYKTCASP